MCVSATILIALVLAGSGGSGTGRPLTPVGSDRGLISGNGRGLISGNNRPFLSVGRDRGLISTGTDRPLISTGRDRGLQSMGRDRPLLSTGRDRPLIPTGGLEQAPVQGEGGSASVAPTVSIVPMGSGGLAASPQDVTAGVAIASPPRGESDRAAMRFRSEWNEASQAMRGREFMRAEQILYSVRGAEPHSWGTRLRYATNLLALGIYDRSLDELVTGLNLRPRDATLPDLEQLFGSGEVKAEVAKRLEDYRTSNPGDAHATLLQAAMQGWTGPTPESTALVRDVSERHPGWDSISALQAGLPKSAGPQAGP